MTMTELVGIVAHASERKIDLRSIKRKELESFDLEAYLKFLEMHFL